MSPAPPFRINARLRMISPMFGRDRSGSVAIMASFAMLLIVGVAAISIDGSNYFYQRRRQQTATDFAALAAAGNLAQNVALAGASTAANGFSPDATSAVETGVYNSSLAVGQRFTPTTVAPNAVRVTMRTKPSFIFGAALGIMAGSVASPSTAGTGRVAPDSGFAVRTQAVASNQDTAAFSLGTGLAALNGGVENAVLSAFLGAQLSLTAMDWQSLASANVNLFSFSKALATRASIAGTTYGSVAAASVTRAQALGAVQDVLQSSGANGSARTAIAQIATTAGLGGATIVPGSLVSFGPYDTLSIAATQPTTATVSAFDLVSAILQLANDQHMVEGAMSAPVAGIASVTFKLVIGEPIRSTSLIAVGAEGTTLHSAQTRVLLSMELVGTAQGAAVTLPLYVEVANGTARLSGIACASGGATLGVTPGVADAWIGSVSTSDFNRTAATPAPTPATLLNLLGLAQVTGRAHATISNLNPTSVSFSAADIAAGTRKTTSTTDYTASLYGSLLSNLQLSVTALSVFTVPVGLDASVKQVLVGATSAVDLLVNQVFSALGVSVGNASTSVTGVKCGRSIIVN